MNTSKFLTRFIKKNDSDISINTHDTDPGNDSQMTMANKIKIGAIVLIFGSTLASVLGYSPVSHVMSLFEQQEDDDSEQIARLASTLAKVADEKPVPPIQKSPGLGNIDSLSSSSDTQSKDSSTNNSTNNGNNDFVVAPDYRTLNAMMALYANAANPASEKNWIELRLSVKAAREYKNLANERLETAKARKALLDLESQIKSLQTSNTSNSLANNGDNNSFSRMQLIGLFDRGGNIFSADIMIDGEVFRGQFVGSKFDDYTLKSINEKDRCVTVTSKYSHSQAICL